MSVTGADGINDRATLPVQRPRSQTRRPPPPRPPQRPALPGPHRAGATQRRLSGRAGAGRESDRHRSQWQCGRLAGGPIGAPAPRSVLEGAGAEARPAPSPPLVAALASPRPARPRPSAERSGGHGGEGPQPQGGGSPCSGRAGGEHQRGPRAPGRAEDQPGP